MPFLKNAWYVAAHAHELNAGMVARTIANEPVVMFRKSDGSVAAIQDRCPHRFVPLSMGKRVGDSVQCAYHGLAFDGSGACTDAPNDDEAQRQRICVRAFAAVERYKVVWLWLGEVDTADDSLIPTFDFLSDTQHYAVARGYSHIKANYELLADNLLDLSHVHYLHPGMHDSDFAGFTNKLRVEGDTVWSMLYRHNYHLDERRQKQMGFDTDDVEGQGHSRWNAPGNLLVDTAYWEHGKSIAEPGALRSPSAHLLTPETESTTHYFWGSGRNNHLDNQAMTRNTEERMHVIFETQDGPMCEAQQRYLGTGTDFLDARPMILKADAAGVAARRVTRRKLREEAAGAMRAIAPAREEAALVD